MFHDLLAVQNKAIVLNFYKSFDNRRLEEGLSLLSADLIAHMAGTAEPLDRTGFIRLGTEVYTAFPDGQHTFSQVIAHRDTIVTTGFFTGTHLGTFQGLPPTRRPVRFAVMHIDRVSYGKIVEHWGQGDSLSLVRQMGVKLVPSAGMMLKMGLKTGQQFTGKIFDRMSAVAQPDSTSEAYAPPTKPQDPTGIVE